jgi:hypothetical protein
MPTESPKLKRLRELRQLLASGKFQAKELKSMTVADTDGRNVRLTEPDALDVLDRRIAEQEAQEGNAA